MLRRFLAILAFIAAPAFAGSVDPRTTLASGFPFLDALYQRYTAYQTQLSTFAIQQGFIDPAEILGTVVHEMIHIDSAANGGFNIAGTYIAPYLTPTAWPFLNNRDVTAYLTRDEIAHLGMIYGSYMRSSPTNRLGNVLDEINAYSQTIPYLCTTAPARAPAHVQALTGHLALVDVYLRILADRFPEQYQKLAASRVSRGALETIVAGAYRALNGCYAQHIAAADPRLVLKSATEAFAALPAPR
ncbi:hypothetical protein RHDC4_00747 [Rhodocyclaceae bacterium]|nr:hypothetical protein RHDC4_00747 [Rhodocyclaceae bacterium]